MQSHKSGVRQSLATAPDCPHGITRRGLMHQRILALLQDYPDGLSPAQVRHMLDVDKTMGHTLIAMARDGLLVRLRPGVYALRE
jgi:hypothetical protein